MCHAMPRSICDDSAREHENAGITTDYQSITNKKIWNNNFDIISLYSLCKFRENKTKFQL
ncbi:hypothetical protein B566_EDAN015009 [Ephemera danica]|nr:hypothetical protein B566_EDAN015009 [Ephemera danica]